MSTIIRAFTLNIHTVIPHNVARITDTGSCTIDIDYTLRMGCVTETFFWGTWIISFLTLSSSEFLRQAVTFEAYSIAEEQVPSIICRKKKLTHRG